MKSTSCVKDLKTRLLNWSNSRSAQPRDEERQTDRRLVITDVVWPLFETRFSAFITREEELQDHSLNAACICWILETSTDPDVISTAVRWIPAVEWHDGIAVEPSLPLLCDTAYSDPSSDIVSTPHEEFAPLKAIMHLATQRPRVSQGGMDWRCGQRLYEAFPRNRHVSIKRRLADVEAILLLGALGYRTPGNVELSDHAFRIMLDSLSPSFLAWMCHNLVYLVVRSYPDSIPERISDILKHCLSRDVPHAVKLDCALIIAVSLGMPLHCRDLSVMDKRSVVVLQLLRILS